MLIKTDVIKNNKGERHPNYDGDYTVVEDNGDTMKIKIPQEKALEILEKDNADLWYELMKVGE